MPIAVQTGVIGFKSLPRCADIAITPEWDYLPSTAELAYID